MKCYFICVCAHTHTSLVCSPHITDSSDANAGKSCAKQSHLSVVQKILKQAKFFFYILYRSLILWFSENATLIKSSRYCKLKGYLEGDTETFFPLF